MNTKKLEFLLTVANKYRKACPELSRMITTQCLTTAQGSQLTEFLENYREKLCEHCGTIFTANNCRFRIKPKRKHRKRRTQSSRRTECEKTQTGGANFDANSVPKRSNYLQISCEYCGWKSRVVGTGASKREPEDNNGSRKSTGDGPVMTPLGTPKLTSKRCSASPSFSEMPSSSRQKKKPRTRLKELLAMEKEAADHQMTASPSLMNFLASV